MFVFEISVCTFVIVEYSVASCGRFLPGYCPGFVPVSPEAGAGFMEKEMSDRDKKKNNLRLDFPFWLVAWDGYSVAAAALEQVNIRHVFVYLCTLVFGARWPLRTRSITG